MYFLWIHLFVKISRDGMECMYNNCSKYSRDRQLLLLFLNNAIITPVSCLMGCDTAVAYPGICSGEGGSTNSVEDRENGYLEAVAP